MSKKGGPGSLVGSLQEKLEQTEKELVAARQKAEAARLKAMQEDAEGEEELEVDEAARDLFPFLEENIEELDEDDEEIAVSTPAGTPIEDEDDEEEIAAIARAGAPTLTRAPASPTLPRVPSDTSLFDTTGDVAHEALHAKSNTALFSSTATKEEPELPLKPRGDLLTQEQYDLYHQQYGDPPEKVFQMLIDALNNSNVDRRTRSQTTNFIAQLDKAMPFFELAYAAAQKEAHDSPEEENLNKLNAVKKLHDSIQSLRSLAHNQIRYTNVQFDNQKKEIIQALEKANVPPEIQGSLREALDNVVSSQLYSESGPRTTQFLGGLGSTSFEAGKNDEKHLSKYRKRNEMNIMDKGEPPNQQISVRFSYPRGASLGTGTFGTATNGQTRLNSQVEAFVKVMLNEYKPPKGSQANPINIHFVPPEIDRSDEALAILMEYKKQAMRTGETFYMKDPKDPSKPLIKITPDPNFSPREQEAFMHFAKGVPQHRSMFGNINKANACAGYKLFKGEGTFPKGEHNVTEDQLLNGMLAHLKNTDEKYKSQLGGRIDQALQQGPGPAPEAPPRAMKM